VLWIDLPRIDLPLCAAVAIVCLPVFRTDRMVSRREGIAFVVATWCTWVCWCSCGREARARQLGPADRLELAAQAA
jgi:hypothetical protein